MIQGNTPPQAEGLEDPPAKEAKLKNGARLKGSRKLSREALQLINGNALFFEGVPIAAPAQLPAAKAKGRASVADNTGQGDHQDRAEDAVNDDKTSKHKRSSSDADAAAADGKSEHERKRKPKKPKSSEHQRKVLTASTEAEDANGGARQAAAEPAEATAGHRTRKDADASAPPTGSEHNDKAEGACASRGRPQLDVDAQGVPDGRMKPGEPDATRMSAATSDQIKNLRKLTGQTHVAAGPSRTTEGMHTKAGKLRAAQQAEGVVAAHQAAEQTATEAPRTSAPPLDTAQAPKAEAGTALPRPNARLCSAATSTEPSPSFIGGLAAADVAEQRNETSGSEAVQHMLSPGSTPLKAFMPIALPRLEDSKALVELQRQLSEMRTLYEELKATKIQDLETVLAEQVEFAEEQVRNAQEDAQRWKAAAERAEAKAKSARSQETADRIAAQDRLHEQLKQENGDLLLRVAHLERELALTQQELHDARAELLQFNEAMVHGSGFGVGEEAMAAPKVVDAHLPQVVHAEAVDNDGAADGAQKSPVKEPAPHITLGGGHSPGVSEPHKAGAAAAGSESIGGHQSVRRGVGQQFPTPSPGIQFPSPSGQPFALQATGKAPGSPNRSAGRGVSTECQRIVQMLPILRARSPSIQSQLRSGSVPRMPQGDQEQGLLGCTQEAGSLNGSEHGVSTHCQRVVQMLPGLREPSSSIQSCLPSGLVPLAMQADSILASREDHNGVSPSVGVGVEGQAQSRPSSGKRQSAGSPIDGICGSGNRKPPGASALADMSHARNLGAPEAFKLAFVHKGRYSFVDLDPVSARKTPRGGMLGASQGASTPAGPLVAVCHGEKSVATYRGPINMQAQEQGPTAAARVAAVVAAAAEKALPPSPTIEREANAVALETAAVLHAGSAESNQGSCNLSGLVARAMAQQHDVRHVVCAGPHVRRSQAGDDRSPVSAHKQAAATPTPAMDIESPGGPKKQAQGTVPAVHNGQGARNSSPSPRTAKLLLYENFLEWHVDVISTKPVQAYRISHLKCGMVFELCQTDLEEEDLLDDDVNAVHSPGVLANTADGNSGTKYFAYTPIDFGNVGHLLPTYLKEGIIVTADQRPKLLEKLDEAVKAARAKAQ